LIEFICFLIIVSCFTNLNSQTLGPKKHQFDWNGTSTYLDADSSYFDQSVIIRGWHWDAPTKFNRESKSNHVDVRFESLLKIRNLEPNTYVSLIPNPTSHGGANLLNAYCIQFEPTLLVDNANPMLFNKKENDTTGAIFGFRKIKGTIPISTSDPNFDRLIVGGAQMIGDTVLAESWPDDKYLLAERIMEMMFMMIH
jgi:hypothetical protein